VPPEGPRPSKLPSRRRPAWSEAATPAGSSDVGVGSVEVFSVEDCCSKSIEGLCETMPLASLVEKVKYEFGMSASEALCLSFGTRQFGDPDLPAQLRDLGIREGSMVSFTMPQSEFFEVAVTDLAGNRFVVKDLQPEMRLGMLVFMAEKAMSLHDEAVQLILGTLVLGGTSSSKTLEQLGIRAGCELSALKRLRPQGSCPKCCSGISARCDVTIGATHEGWGRRWNRCNYDCERCGSEILHGEAVNACHRCKCFWHRSCKLAQMPAMSS